MTCIEHSDDWFDFATSKTVTASPAARSELTLAGSKNNRHNPIAQRGTNGHGDENRVT